MSTFDLKTLQYITDDAGAKSAVILPIDEFYQLLEDLADLVVAAERREEETISHADLLKELAQDGIV